MACVADAGSISSAAGEVVGDILKELQRVLLEDMQQTLRFLGHKKLTTTHILAAIKHRLTDADPRLASDVVSHVLGTMINVDGVWKSWGQDGLLAADGDGAKKKKTTKKKKQTEQQEDAC
jgi:hypothetical protein